MSGMFAQSGLCLGNNTGPYCETCPDGFVSDQSGVCISCADDFERSTDWTKLLGLGGLYIIFVLVACTMIYRNHVGKPVCALPCVRCRRGKKESQVADSSDGDRQMEQEKQDRVAKGKLFFKKIFEKEQRGEELNTTEREMRKRLARFLPRYTTDDVASLDASKSAQKQLENALDHALGSFSDEELAAISKATNALARWWIRASVVNTCVIASHFRQLAPSFCQISRLPCCCI